MTQHSHSSSVRCSRKGEEFWWHGTEENLLPTKVPLRHLKSADIFLKQQVIKDWGGGQSCRDSYHLKCSLKWQHLNSCWNTSMAAKLRIPRKPKYFLARLQNGSTGFKSSRGDIAKAKSYTVFPTQVSMWNILFYCGANGVWIFQIHCPPLFPHHDV